MKQQIAAACMMMALSGAAMSQGSDPGRILRFPAPVRVQATDARVIERNYASVLGDESSGVVESALGQVAYIALCRPDVTFSGIRRKVDSLMLHGASPSVRYKAFLTAFVMDSRTELQSLPERKMLTVETIFPVIAEQLGSATIDLAGSN